MKRYIRKGKDNVFGRYLVSLIIIICCIGYINKHCSCHWALILLINLDYLDGNAGWEANLDRQRRGVTTAPNVAQGMTR